MSEVRFNATQQLAVGLALEVRDAALARAEALRKQADATEEAAQWRFSAHMTDLLKAAGVVAPTQDQNPTLFPLDAPRPEGIRWDDAHPKEVAP